MKKNLIFLLLLAVIPILCFGKNDAPVIPDYDISSAGSAVQGYYLVNVSAYVKKSKGFDNNVLLRCAIHGVLFKGFAGTNRLTSQKPLAGNASVEQQHIDYFKLFFTDGTFKRYATLQDGSIQLEKVGKMYKISGIVLVSKEQLRSDLEKEGIVKGLNSGF